MKNFRIIGVRSIDPIINPGLVVMTASRRSSKKVRVSGTDSIESISIRKELQQDNASLKCISPFLKQYSLPIMVFLAALFISITFSNAALFLNDEWITVNQLHQLDEGQQLIVNEGKYGVFMNGTPGPYFLERNNLLGYTLMLPILSLPALKMFSLFGDQFRSLVILIWAFLPVAIALLADFYYPQYARWRGIRWIWPVIGASFAGLLLNLLLYSPFPYSAIDAPREVAAVVFTNHILFALMAMSIFLICRIAFKNSWFAIFGTIACISCSSYIFWAANAKEHMLVVAMLSFVLLFMVRYVDSGRYHDAALSFVFVGLLAWARPEVALPVFVLLAAYFVALPLWDGTLKRDSSTGALRVLSAPLFTLIGAIPLFINNLYATGNALVPAFYVYEKALWQGADGGGAIIGAKAAGDVVQSVPAPSGGAGGFISVIANYFTVSWATLPQDVFSILFAPESGNMSLVAVCPLIILALVILPLFLWRQPSRFSPTDRKAILLFAVIGVAVLIAYLRSLHGLNISSGIIPDIRYLTPLYLPAGLLGVYAIWAGVGQSREKALALVTGASELVITPLLIIIMLLVQPYGGLYAGYTAFFTQATFIVLAAAVVMLFAAAVEGGLKSLWLMGAIVLLIAIPLGWQVMMLFLYSVAKFNGYPLWIPVVESLFNTIIGVDIHMPSP